LCTNTLMTFRLAFPIRAAGRNGLCKVAGLDHKLPDKANLCYRQLRDVIEVAVITGDQFRVFLNG